MGNILVFIEHQNGKIHKASLESVRGGQALKEATGYQLTAIAFGLTDSSDELQALALDEVLLPDNGTWLADYSSEAYVHGMAQVVGAENPDVILAAYTYQARDWLPRLSARLDVPLVSDCTGFRTENGLVWTRPVLQGKMTADTTAGDQAIVAFQTGAFSTDDLASGSPTLRHISLSEDGLVRHTRPGNPFQEAKGAVDLGQAQRIVAVGRGVGEEENLQLVRDLAQTLGAEVGSSRPVVDYGWLEHDRQVGSSGQVVSPKLYLAVGISGAIQHQVGMKGSGCIVAINRDPHAPIFEIADYGLVGDLFEIVPKLTEALQNSQDA